MTKSMEWNLERMGRPLDGEPDYEAMWSRIEERLAHKNQLERASQRGIRHKKKVLVLVASVSILAALPAMAAVNGSWDSLWNGRSSFNAIEQGVGNRINQTVTSGGIPLTLDGVATDDQRMNMLLTMNVSDLPTYDAIEFGRSELSEGKDKAKRIQVQLKQDQGQGRLFGLATVQNKLGEERKSYRLTLENIVFYQYRNFPLDVIPAESQDKTAALSGGPVTSVEMTSVIRKGNVFTVRYKLSGVNQEAARKANPHLVLISGGQVIKEKYAAVLPSEDPNVIVCQSNFEISDADLKKSHFELSVLEESGRKEGSWNFAFEADGKKAAQAMFAVQLEPADVANDSMMKFTELVITPLEIRLMYEMGGRSPQPDVPLIHYESVKLIVDGQEMDSGSGFWTTKDGRFYRRFELPQWYEQKDWSNVPMKVILSGKKVQERANKDHLLTLDQPAAQKKTVTTELHGTSVEFTYYKEGKDLIVESSSSDPSFGGITQSYLDINGERKFPEINPNPPEGNGTNRKVERYVNIPEGDLKLNPFLYQWFDPKARVELNLR
ncbi:hypothetical protein DCC85_11225 [Paenibacillus sp. CAA11]|uniref:DUF4179 domain-containing protein n=1 Tax=Paenibacillus sp. CAA11 TaxID=1532905 RepID=UPI000D344ACE|nr:DUF4179 domain-containing protein [Paenibacillus sp. CAA11]AWB44731.1 hypothetical protein DCC85_11225 [Paenibacillus sp. CAA11]